MFGAPLGEQLAGAVGRPGQLAVFLGVLALIGAVATVSFRRTRRVPGPSPLLPYLSYGTVIFAAFLPLAAGLYLLATTAFTTAERALLSRRTP